MENTKKSVMAQVINIFILVLVISVLAGMTFLFVSQLKDNIEEVTATTGSTTYNESGYINATGYTLDNASLLGFNGVSILAAFRINTSDGAVVYLIPAANYTVTSAGDVYNATVDVFDYDNVYDYKNSTVNFTYSFSSIAPEDEKAYLAINKTEAAGYNVTKYLTLLFLALIFGAILIVVLRVILPYINVGKQIGGEGF